MLSTDLTAALAAEHSRELMRAAEASRLVAEARRGRPRSRRRVAAKLSEALATARRRLPRPSQASHDVVSCADV